MSRNDGFDFHRLQARWARQQREAQARSLRLLERVQRRARPILDQNGAARAWVFGSVAAGCAREDSDLDLLVLGTAAEDYWALRAALEAALGRSLDLLTEADDPKVVQQAMAQGIAIYDRESAAAAGIDRG
ncbi:MAG: nucleotidyltransferase domain-containing protein [Gammaproteobacteria bacterium]|nr:nucleotidyltransferase domain-containing protein [Gammaproteobacteria bacterium]